MTDKLSSLATVRETRRVLEAHGLMTKKALGQHFLINDDVVRKICDLAAVSNSDNVIEVGPGIGTLTVALLQLAGHVIAVERDSDLPAVLAETTADVLQEHKNSFTLIEGDALEVKFDQLSPQPNKLISNLPYAVAATIVLDYFEKSRIDSATVMVQAEVADRMMAERGTKNYGAYTVKLSLYAKPAGKFQVSENNFFPPPRVKSTVIRLDRVDENLSPQLLQATACMADAAFATRRKTLANSCKTFFSQDHKYEGILAGLADKDMASQLSVLFDEAQINPQIRGEQLTREEFIRLGKALLRFLESRQ